MNGIKGNPVVVKNIAFVFLDVFYKISVVRGKRKKALTVFLADPKDKTAVRDFPVMDDQTVRSSRRDQEEVSVFKGEWGFLDLHTDVSFQEKVKFIVGMGMEGYVGGGAVVVVVELEILGEHVLAGGEEGLKVFAHGGSPLGWGGLNGTPSWMGHAWVGRGRCVWGFLWRSLIISRSA